MATRLDSNDSGFEDAFVRLLETKRGTEPDVDDAVRAILADVREKGDEAVIAYTREFDGFELSSETMAVTGPEIEAAKEAVLEAGGLHVIGTERHESRRIDNQLRGRAGR